MVLIHSLHPNHVRFLLFERIPLDLDHARIRRRALPRS